MSATKQDQSLIGNFIIRSLPRNEYERLEPHLKLIPLETRTVLYLTDDPIEYLYFPNSGMVSLVSLTVDG
jgi:CRP-like cAMP-binding protein